MNYLITRALQNVLGLYWSLKINSGDLDIATILQGHIQYIFAADSQLGSTLEVNNVTPLVDNQCNLTNAET